MPHSREPEGVTRPAIFFRGDKMLIHIERELKKDIRNKIVISIDNDEDSNKIRATFHYWGLRSTPSAWGRNINSALNHLNKLYGPIKEMIGR